MCVWAIVLLTLDICSWSTVKMTNKLLLYILLKVGPSISNTFYDTTQFIISIQNEVLPFSKTFNSKYLVVITFTNMITLLHRTGNSAGNYNQ